MTPRAVRLLACAVGVAALMQPAHALRIDALDPVTPVVADMVTPVVSAGTLQMELAPQHTLTVAPWPSYLPQQFGAQSITAVRQLNPSGPTDRLSFSRAAGKPAWLHVVSGARPQSAVVGPWQLRLSARGWSLRSGKTHIRLEASERYARPAMVAAGNARWCVYLLDAKTAQPQAGLAVEQEAQADWAAVRIDARRKRCPAQQAAPR